MVHYNVHSVGDHDHCSFFYVCKALNAKQLKINKELQGFRWISKEEVNKDFVPEGVRNVALKAFEYFSL